jgi:hypothetical protein
MIFVVVVVVVVVNSLCSLILNRLKIRNVRLGTTENKCNWTPGAIPKSVQEVLQAIVREVEQVYYNPQITRWSLQRRWQKRMRKISWQATGCYYPPWKHSHVPHTRYTVLETLGVFSMRVAAELPFAPATSSPLSPAPHSSTLLLIAPETSTRNHGGDRLLGYNLYLI